MPSEPLSGDALATLAELRVAFDGAAKDLAAVIDDLIHKYGEASVKLAARDLYNRRFAPIDIPLVPDMLEPLLIDTPVLLAIDQGISQLHKLVHVDPPAPTT